MNRIERMKLHFSGDDFADSGRGHHTDLVANVIENWTVDTLHLFSSGWMCFHGPSESRWSCCEIERLQQTGIWAGVWRIQQMEWLIFCSISAVVNNPGKIKGRTERCMVTHILHITALRYNPNLWYTLWDTLISLLVWQHPPPIKLIPSSHRQLLSDIRGWQGSLLASDTRLG